MNEDQYAIGQVRVFRVVDFGHTDDGQRVRGTRSEDADDKKNDFESTDVRPTASLQSSHRKRERYVLMQMHGSSRHTVPSRPLCSIARSSDVRIPPEYRMAGSDYRSETVLASMLQSVELPPSTGVGRVDVCSESSLTVDSTKTTDGQTDDASLYLLTNMAMEKNTSRRTSK